MGNLVSKKAKSVKEPAADKQSNQNEKLSGKKTSTVSCKLPMFSYEESLLIANAIWECSSGQKVRRLTLFNHIGKSPDSGTSRSLITNSSKYGLTKGGYQADYLELTPDGSIATNPEETSSNKLLANFKLAIQHINYFNLLYERFKDMKVPSNSVLIDTLVEAGLDTETGKKCVELFLNNARFIGIIKVISGSERILTIDHVIEEMSDHLNSVSVNANQGLNYEPHQDAFTPSGVELDLPEINDSADDWDNVCFYITAIGSEDSEERKHSDLFLESIVQPAIEEFGLKVVRADKISKAGMITSHVIEHIIRAKLVIADLSFTNPNVFYELSLRHAYNLPAIHIIRQQDTIPFDIQDFRTIVIDTTDIYTLIPRLGSYKAEISRQVRQLLESPESLENPISMYLDKLRKDNR